MDAQADELRGEGNRRNGYRERRLPAVVGEATPRMPRPGEGGHFPEGLPRPCSRVDRATVACAREAYVRGLSARRTGAAAGALESGSPSPSRASRMAAGLDEGVAAMRAERFDGLRFPYLWLDATYVRRGDEGHAQSRAAVTAIACGEDGSRRLVGPGCAGAESASPWKAFLRGLRRRGVSGARCAASDAHEGLVQAVAEVFPGAAWQRCIVHLERDVAGWVPTRRDRSRARAALKAVFAERDPALVRAAYHRACAKVSALSRRAGEPLGDAEEDALAYLDFPREHHLRLRTDNIQERANEEIKHRTRVVNVFPSVGRWSGSWARSS
jgi:transposase-like protein